MKYKVGDRVKVISTFDGKDLKGKIGTIVGLGESCRPFEVGVEFDEPFTEGHTCTGKAKGGHGRYGRMRDLELVVDNKKIIITSDGAETLARLYEGNKVVKSATAKCSPDDTFVFEEGARIAFHRLIGDYAESKAKKPHIYKAGDKVKVIANTCCHSCKIGEIVTLKDICEANLGEKTAWHIREHLEYIRECDFKPYTEPAYYNGKVVCVKPEIDMTVGKVYEIKNGKLLDDAHDERPFGYSEERILSLDEGWAKGRVIAFVG